MIFEYTKESQILHTDFFQFIFADLMLILHWYVAFLLREQKAQICAQITTLLIIYIIALCCRYASLYFCCAVEDQDNELITLEIIHRYVELLDKYFGSVSF